MFSVLLKLMDLDACCSFLGCSAARGLDNTKERLFVQRSHSPLEVALVKSTDDFSPGVTASIQLSFGFSCTLKNSCQTSLQLCNIRISHRSCILCGMIWLATIRCCKSTQDVLEISTGLEVNTFVHGCCYSLSIAGQQLSLPIASIASPLSRKAQKDTANSFYIKTPTQNNCGNVVAHCSHKSFLSLTSPVNK